MRRLPTRRIEVLAALAVCAVLVGVGYANSSSEPESDWTSYAPLSSSIPDLTTAGYLEGPGGTPLVCNGKRMTAADAEHPPKPPEGVDVTAVVARCGENGTVTWVYATTPTP